MSDDRLAVRPTAPDFAAMKSWDVEHARRTHAEREAQHEHEVAKALFFFAEGTPCTCDYTTAFMPPGPVITSVCKRCLVLMRVDESGWRP